MVGEAVRGPECVEERPGGTDGSTASCRLDPPRLSCANLAARGEPCAALDPSTLAWLEHSRQSGERRLELQARRPPARVTRYAVPIHSGARSSSRRIAGRGRDGTRAGGFSPVGIGCSAPPPARPAAARAEPRPPAVRPSIANAHRSSRRRRRCRHAARRRGLGDRLHVLQHLDAFGHRAADPPARRPRAAQTRRAAPRWRRRRTAPPTSAPRLASRQEGTLRAHLRLDGEPRAGRSRPELRLRRAHARLRWASSRPIAAAVRRRCRRR